MGETHHSDAKCAEITMKNVPNRPKMPIQLKFGEFLCSQKTKESLKVCQGKSRFGCPKSIFANFLV